MGVASCGSCNHAIKASIEVVSGGCNGRAADRNTRTRFYRSGRGCGIRKIGVMGRVELGMYVTI